MTVRLLEDTLVNQIAAGEVVERPASVLKELLENSLDAGATTLDVTLKAGGRSQVRVADDGEGMDRDDALMCLERHATSKIRTADDLLRVGTLGFRGEAVPSIASVARVRILTRRHDRDVGTRVKIEGGQVQDVSDAGCAAGTDFDVRDLFFNVPVRRGFLRSAATELEHCLEAVKREAMLRPDVDVTVTHEGRVALRAPAADGLAARARDLLGDDAERLAPVEFQEEGLAVRGLVSPIGLHRATATGGMYLYVNGRFVRDPVMRRALAEAYSGLVPRGRHPVVVLEVRLDPLAVDVNVHPSKTEVRFHSPRDLVRVVGEGVRQAVQAHGLRRTAERPRVDPGLFAPAPPPPERPAVPAHPADDPRFRAAPAPVVAPTPAPHPEPAPLPQPPAPLMVSEPGPPQRRYRDLAVLGTLADAFLLCQADDGLVVLHLGRARAALAAARLRRDGAGAPQRLLTPAVVDLTRADAERLHARLGAFEALGVLVEPFGPASFAVRSVPAAVVGADVRALLADLLASDDAVAALARHVPDDAVTSAWESRVLLAALDEAGAPPVAVSIPLDELERRFRRP